jgi:H+/Cl- antiporter ClcA
MFLSRRSIQSGLFQILGSIMLALPVGLVVGSATAFFLWALDVVTAMQWGHPGLLWFLPLGGVAVGWLYQSVSKGSDKGMNLLLDEIHEPRAGVPARMAPLVLLGTLVTHLFGGSAGREGTAVQMGGGLASLLARWFHLNPQQQRWMLMCGIAAGFGAVFGTPLTGALFAMEVMVIGRLKYDAVVAVLIASVVGHFSCTAWGIEHTAYALVAQPLQISQLAKAALAGLAFGLAARFYAELSHGIQYLLSRAVSLAPLRPAVGAVIVMALVYALGTRDYLGLGVEAGPGGQVSIVASFQEGGATPWSWLWKTIFTAVTCGSGFKGGEVTPLFFIGSTLGNTLALLLHEPVSLFAGLGLIAVFAGASKTPLACTVMGMELFGAHYALYFALVCYTAFYASGHSGIYLSQRLAGSHETLREVRSKRRFL